MLFRSDNIQSMLEIGASSGYNLSLYDEISTRVGIEPSLANCVSAKKKYGINISAACGDIFVTATGCRDTICVSHMLKMKDRAILANAGHFNVEIDIEGLEIVAVSKRETRRNITRYTLENGKTVNVISEGRLVNIAAGDGHPAEIMDMSFAVQALSVLYIKENHNKLDNRVMDVSDEIDRKIAFRKLEAWGITNAKGI